MKLPTDKKLKIVCVGEAMLELSLGELRDAQIDFAGDTLNTAVYLKRLAAHELDVSYCTAVGTDALSGRLVDFIASEHIDTSAIQRAADRTIGLYAISTDDQGERSFTYWRNESAARTLFQRPDSTSFETLGSFDVIYLSAITLAILPAGIRQQLLEAIVRLQRQQQTVFAFDSNYRPKLWESAALARSTVESFWQITDIALPSVDDEQQLFGDDTEQAVINRFQRYGVSRGVLKRGDAGPLSLATDQAELAPDQLTTAKVVDTTAAGDSFNAGYLSAILTGGSHQQAMLAGQQCATRVIACRGAIVPAAEWFDR